MATYNAGSASVEIKPSLKGFARDLKADLERIQAKYSVDVDADLTTFRARMASLRDEGITLEVDADTAAAEARIDAAARDRTVKIDVDDKGGLGRVTRGAGEAHRGLSAMSAVKFSGLVGAIGALVPALLGAAGAAGGAAAAIGAIGATGLIGSGGMLGAFTALKDETAGAGQAADELAGKQEAAEKAARDVADAQQDLADAQKDAKQAQEDLAESYEEGRRALRDLNDAATDAVLAQEDAEIALARAQERRNRVYRDSSSSALDRAEADNNVRKQQQRLKEARSERADKTADAAEANAKGVAGSAPVVKAQEAKAAADKRVAESQQQLTDAMKNLAKAQAEVAKGAAGTSAAAAAMAKLAPAAQEFVRQVRDLGPAWTDLRLAVQQELFAGLGDSVTMFANQNLPGLKASLTDIAGYMNGAFKNTLSGLTTEFANLSAGGQLDGLKATIAGALEGTPGLVTGLTNGLVNMGSALAPVIGPLLESLGGLFREIGPSLGAVGAQLAAALTDLMPHLGSFISALAEGLGPVLPVLGTLLASFGDALQPLIPAISDIAQTIGNALAAALPTVVPFFEQFLGLIGDLLKVVEPLLPPLLEILSAVLTPLATVLRTIVQTGLIPFAQTLATALQPAIDKLAPILAEVGKTIGAAWTEALQKLMPHMPKLITALVDASTAMLPILPPLAEIAVTLLPLMAETLAILLPHLSNAIQLFGAMASSVAPLVASALQTVADLLGRVGDLASWVGEKFDLIVNWVKDLPSKITAAASGMWDGIKDAFKAMLNWIFKAWNDMSLTLRIPVVNKRVTIDTPDIPLLKADGGLISGPGTATSDSIPAMLSDGEYVVRQAAVAKYGKPFFDEVNAGHYAEGGLVAAKSFAQSMAGVPYQMGGFSRQSIDCSGLVGAVVRVARGDSDPFDTPRDMSTVNEGPWLAAHGFKEGKGSGNDLTVGWYDQGGGANGHTAGHLGSTPFESHGPEGSPALYGAGQGANQSIFTNWMHLPTTLVADPKNPNSGSNTPFDPNQQNNQDGRDAPQKYKAGPGEAHDRYPTSLSGWAGFVAKGFAEGYTKSTLGTLGIPDTPNWLTGVQELNKQVQFDKPWNRRGDNGLPPVKYDSGGWLMPGTTMTRNETRQPEAVLTATQWSTAERAMQTVAPAMATPTAAPSFMSELVDAIQSGDTFNISTARVEDAFLEARTRQEQQAAGRIRR